MAELTPKQQRFVDEYLIDLNATQAAIRAGYSEKNASRIASELLDKTHVKKAIEAARDERSEETKIDAAWVLKRLAAEAEADVADLYDDDGNLLPVKHWPKIWRQGLVAGVDISVEKDKDGNEVAIIKKVKVSDRVRRLELIGKHIGVNAFQDIVEHKGLDSLADRLARASKRSRDND